MHKCKLSLGLKSIVHHLFLFFVRFFDEHKQIKVKMVLFCNMARTNLSTGETIHTKAPFASRIHEILEGTDINGLSNTMVGRILENLATFQSVVANGNLCLLEI